MCGIMSSSRIDVVLLSACSPPVSIPSCTSRLAPVTKVHTDKCASSPMAVPCNRWREPKPNSPACGRYVSQMTAREDRRPSPPGAVVAIIIHQGQLLPSLSTRGSCCHYFPPEAGVLRCLEFLFYKSHTVVPALSDPDQHPPVMMARIPMSRSFSMEVFLISATTCNMWTAIFWFSVPAKAYSNE